MMLQSLTALYDQELDKLDAEIRQYSAPTTLWSVHPGISNSGGTLTLHICGNLRHFIGAILGHSGYVRNRDAEFSTRGLSTAELSTVIALTRAEVSRTLLLLEEGSLSKPYPLRVVDQDWLTGKFLMHIYGHLQYHRGQVNYHRRFAESGWMY